MKRISEVKKKVRRQEWLEMVEACQNSGKPVKTWCRENACSAERAAGMLKGIRKEHIYIVCGHTDMRKSIDGLAAIIQCQFSLDLYTDSLFLFCGKRRDRMKALLWDGDGFLLLYKRLDGGKFS